MRIETLTCLYNEEFLIPYYLKHYAWCDQINILFDEATNDNSLALLNEAANKQHIKIIPFTFPDGLDDHLKVRNFNREYLKLKCDMAIVSDFDEFLFIDRKKIAELPEHNVYWARSGYVFRNLYEEDLDPEVSVMANRRHGEWTGKKPMLAKVGAGIQWVEGNHRCNYEPLECGVVYSHWSMADPCFIAKRRVADRRDRMSQVNRSQGMGTQYFKNTEQDGIDECKQHENDERLW